MISQNTIQQILSRIDIVEVVGNYVKLRKRGANYLGLCPFHNEKTPSFTVSPSKEIYKCFGCGKSGNTIGFLMDVEKYSYVEALRWLAARYNVEIEETEVSPEQRQQQQTADSLYIINQFAQQFFSDTLFNSEEGQNIGLSYLRERGFTEATARKFQLGYNPEGRDQFAQAALKAQYNPELLQKTGLIVLRDGQAVDNYRGRIIFPIHNQSGKILGFGARILKSNDRAPKYINTPENEIYVKSRILYGSYFARHAIDKNNECLLVEGYTDVISLHQAGIENVVASGGTSLTPDQLRLIKKYTDHLTIIYDGDAAGVKAALRGMDLAFEAGLQVKLVLIPDNEDPDSYVRKVGAGAFREFIAENKKDFILFQLSVSLKDAGNDSSRKAALVNQVAETISRISKPEDFTRRQDYIQQCAQLLKVDENGLNTLVNKFIRERISKEEQKQEKEAAVMQPADEFPAGTDESLQLLHRDELQEKAMVRCLLEFGLRSWTETQTVAQFIFRQIQVNSYHEIFDNQDLIRIVKQYQALYEAGQEPTVRTFLYSDDAEQSRLVVSLMDAKDELSPNWKEYYMGHMPTRDDLYREEVRSCLLYLKLRKVRRQIEENQADLQHEQTPERLAKLLQDHLDLKEEERIVAKTLGTVIFR